MKPVLLKRSHKVVEVVKVLDSIDNHKPRKHVEDDFSIYAIVKHIKELLEARDR